MMCIVTFICMAHMEFFIEYQVGKAENMLYNEQRSLGALAQLGERQVRNLKARGSIPLCSIF